MIFVFGGAYSGKYDFVKEKYHLSDDDIIDFTGYRFDDVDRLSDAIYYHRCIYDIHNLLRGLIDAGIDKKVFLDMIDKIKDTEVICVSDDISCGIVPLDKNDRIYREEVSRVNTYIAKKSTEIYRIFAGIPTKIR